MSIKIEDCEPVQNIPKSKTIVIDGKEMGTAEPRISGDVLRWHSVIRLEDRRLSCRLVQGHGSSPRQAIAASIKDARAERDAFAEKLEWLERQLGTIGKSDAELEVEI